MKIDGMEKKVRFWNRKYNEKDLRTLKDKIKIIISKITVKFKDNEDILDLKRVGDQNKCTSRPTLI